MRMPRTAFAAAHRYPPTSCRKKHFILKPSQPDRFRAVRAASGDVWPLFSRYTGQQPCGKHRCHNAWPVQPPSGLCHLPRWNPYPLELSHRSQGSTGRSEPKSWGSLLHHTNGPRFRHCTRCPGSNRPCKPFRGRLLPYIGKSPLSWHQSPPSVRAVFIVKLALHPYHTEEAILRV